MRAQRYGAVPLARRVGGLADTVEDGVTGFLFDEYSSEDLLRVARAVMDYYYDEAVWKRLMVAGMSRDFSWDRSGEKYMEVYKRVMADPPHQAI
jgi:starch synthase